MEDTQLINFTKSLLETPSFDPKKSNTPQVIKNLLDSNSIRYEVITSNGIENIVAKTNGTSRIILNGHWDTVLPSQEFIKEKLEVVEKDGFLYGLGACDMKSGVAALLATFIHCYKNNIPGIVLCLVGDEEFGGKNGTKYLIEKGVIAPYVILAEPTNLAISLGQKGRIIVTVTAQGKEAHGAYPHKGRNAILLINEFIKQVLTIYPLPQEDTTPEKVFHAITASVNTIQGGTSANVVPNSCEAIIDIRIPAQVDIQEVEKNIKTIAKKVGVTVAINTIGIGWELNQKNKIFTASKNAVEQVIQKEASLVYKMGTNDAKFYIPHGSDVINIGPGDNKLSHTRNEKVSEQEILSAKNIYISIIQGL